MEPVQEQPASSKMYHAIGEVSRMLGVPVPTIRYWEKEFDVIRPKKNKKGDRYFTPQDLEVLKLVRHMVKERGMTIEGARRALKADYKSADDRHQAIQSLKQLREFLMGLKDAIDQRGAKPKPKAGPYDPNTAQNKDA
jgi:DNA-binding transcriptional MerR regulator